MGYWIQKGVFFISFFGLIMGEVGGLSGEGDCQAGSFYCKADIFQFKEIDASVGLAVNWRCLDE